jgi:hypothetical protein
MRPTSVEFLGMLAATDQILGEIETWQPTDRNGCIWNAHFDADIGQVCCFMA